MTAARPASVGRRTLIMFAALLGSVGLARGDDLQVCNDQSGDVALAACTRAIDSGRLSKKNLAVAYTSRGVEWRAKGDVDRAIADHSEAIRIDPTDYLAFFNRGNAYLQKGELNRALADYDAAVRLNRNDADVYHNRALAHQRKGETASANADLAAEKRLRH